MPSCKENNFRSEHGIELRFSSFERSARLVVTKSEGGFVQEVFSRESWYCELSLSCTTASSKNLSEWTSTRFLPPQIRRFLCHSVESCFKSQWSKSNARFVQATNRVDVHSDSVWGDTIVELDKSSQNQDFLLKRLNIALSNGKNRSSIPCSDWRLLTVRDGIVTFAPTCTMCTELTIRKLYSLVLLRWKKFQLVWWTNNRYIQVSCCAYTYEPSCIFVVIEQR